MATIVITGGAGFIGTNATAHFKNLGWEVVVVDNLSRNGSGTNLGWLRVNFEFDFLEIDIRDHEAVLKAVSHYQPDVILHLAAQVAVATSVRNPRLDFEINALGTLNVLEAVRLASPHTFVINASTNKIYGNLVNVTIEERDESYAYKHISGVSEATAVDFHTPYGCSKGVADQYTLDFSRIYGLQAVTLRQSCVYGPHQFGVEDQGWVAWFAIAAVLDRPITIFGNGKQSRDILHVTDLVRCYEAAVSRRDLVNGLAINIGGGINNVLSLRQLINILESNLDKRIRLKWEDWRSGDQALFVSDLNLAETVLNWQPETGVSSGIEGMIHWVQSNREFFTETGFAETGMAPTTVALTSL
jgi:CDP-paratose 2-epimerase